MKTANKKPVGASILIFALILLLSTMAYAAPFTDSFRNGLISINNFFENQGYAPYATAIDFFFFALLFISVYMMGARYAFKEIKKPEQMIVILLGLMTAFLLVLAGISATILLPYIHWLFYLLLFLVIWWLLKGIKSPFWRFLLALLLTILIIALLQFLYDYLTRPQLPDVSGIEGPDLSGIGGIWASIARFFSNLADSFRGIDLGLTAPSIPELPSDLFGESETGVTGPETLPSTTTPAGPTPPVQAGEGRSWLTYLLVLVAILVLAYAGKKGLDRWRGRQRTPTPTALQDIINEIGGIIRKKREAQDKISTKQEEKNHLFQSFDQAQAFVTKLISIDLANIWTDKGRKKIKEEDKWILAFIDKEKELATELKTLKDTEVELYKKLDGWKRFFDSNNLRNTEQIINELKEIIALKTVPIELIRTNPIELKKIGILWLILICYDYEKREFSYSKKLDALLKTDKIKNIEKLLATKFKEIKGNRKRLLENFAAEIGVVKILSDKIDSQIAKLEELKNLLEGAATTGPAAPPKTEHPNWPGPQTGKRDPNPPEKPVFPIKRVLPKPPEEPTKPTRYEKGTLIDLSKKFLPIKNQNNTGACAAFAGASILEYMINPAEDRKDFENDLSELFLWFEARDDKNDNQSGCTLDSISSTLADEGDCFEKYWQWEPLDANRVPVRFAEPPLDNASFHAKENMIDKFRALSPNDPDEWVGELLKGKPILIGVLWDTGLDAAGRAKHSLCNTLTGQNRGGHAVVIVGFTANYPVPQNPQGIPAFKIRNSWGKEWGENGYIWVPYKLLPTLLIDNPVVFEEFKRGEGKKAKAHVLTLTPSENITPTEPIKIIGEYHNAYGEEIELFKIGKIRTDKVWCEIVLEDSKVKEDVHARICYFEFEDDEKTKKLDKFKIFKEKKSKTEIKIDGKAVEHEFITENVKTIQINEYIFNVELSEEEVPKLTRDEYLASFEDKILKLRGGDLEKLINFIYVWEKLIYYLNKDEFDNAKKLTKDHFDRNIIDEVYYNNFNSLIGYIEKNDNNEAVKILNIGKDYFKRIIKTLIEIHKKSPNPIEETALILLRELLKNLDEFIQKLSTKEKLEVKIINPPKEPKPILYIGESVLGLESHASGDKNIIDKVNKEEGFKFVWFLRQEDKQIAIIHTGRSSPNSNNILPSYFDKNEAQLSAVVLDENGKQIGHDSILVELEKRSGTMLPPLKAYIDSINYLPPRTQLNLWGEEEKYVRVEYRQDINARGRLEGIGKKSYMWKLYKGRKQLELPKWLEPISYKESTGALIKIKGVLKPGIYRLVFNGLSTTQSKEFFAQDTVNIEVVQPGFEEQEAATSVPEGQRSLPLTQSEQPTPHQKIITNEPDDVKNRRLAQALRGMGLGSHADELEKSKINSDEMRGLWNRV